MRRLTVVGVVAVALGVAALFELGLLATLDLGSVVVSGLGVLAVLGGLRYAVDRRGRPRRAAEVEPPEPRYRSAVLGGEVETALRTGGQPGIERRAELRRRLRSVAVDVLVAHAGYDRAAAREAVDDGTWTDDGAAAGYLADPVALPRRLRVRNLLRRRSTVRLCVRRSVAAIEEVREP